MEKTYTNLKYFLVIFTCQFFLILHFVISTAHCFQPLRAPGVKQCSTPVQVTWVLFKHYHSPRDINDPCRLRPTPRWELTHDETRRYVMRSARHLLDVLNVNWEGFYDPLRIWLFWSKANRLLSCVIFFSVSSDFMYWKHSCWKVRMAFNISFHSCLQPSWKFILFFSFHVIKFT